MCTISARDFRQNMKALLDRASSGEEVVINRGNEYFLVSKVKVAPVITPELTAKIGKARQEHREGKALRFENAVAAQKWMDEL
jgi:hypothetical protein